MQSDRQHTGMNTHHTKQHMVAKRNTGANRGGETQGLNTLRADQLTRHRCNKTKKGGKTHSVEVKVTANTWGGEISK